MSVVSLVGLNYVDTSEQLGQLFLAQIAIAVLYLAVNGVTIMYEAFKRDREELFDVLKDTR
jgi:hypothetical protein